MRLALLIIASHLSVLMNAQATEQTLTLANMEVAVWQDESAKPIKRPVIIFSHGFHGCSTQSSFLMEAFASAGYIVFAPNHPDATCNDGKGSWFKRPAGSFLKPETWSKKTYNNRAQDIRRLIEAVKLDDRFRTRVDWSRLGLVGHSLGGYTVLGLAGAWPSWRMDNVKAVLALSPYSQPFILHNNLSHLSAPVMYQGGTWDFLETPAMRQAYYQSPRPKYYVEFNRAAHFAWTDFGLTTREAIIGYSLAFMNHYVKGDPADRTLFLSRPGIARIHYAARKGRVGAEDMHEGHGQKK